MEHSLSSETNSFPASQEISHGIWIAVVYDLIYNNTQLLPILRQINLPYALTPYFIKVHLIYFLPFLGLKSCLFLFSFLIKVLYWILLSPYVPRVLSVIRIIFLYEFLVLIPMRHTHTVVFLQDCPPGGAAQPTQVYATAPVAMVETVAEGEAHVERHARRGWDEGSYRPISGLQHHYHFFRSLTKISNLPSLQPHPHF
jgi:hypothetical protein